MNPSMVNLQLRRVIVAALLLCMPWTPASADTVGSEYAVKAAIVYKITKFISWPESAFESSSEPLSICLPADDPIRPAMTGLSGDTVHGRRIEIRPVEAESLTGLDCEVLFVSADSSSDAERLIEQVDDEPVLTVGDGDDFSKVGGIVAMRVRKNRINFEINTDASMNAGLGISAQLLQLAGASDSRRNDR